MPGTFAVNEELERLRQLRDSTVEADREQFDQRADLPTLVSLRSYEQNRARAVAAGATIEGSDS